MISSKLAIWKKANKGDYGTKKALEASDEEKAENSKSKSAKLYSFVFNWMNS